MIDYNKLKEKEPIVPTRVGAFIICILLFVSLAVGGFVSAVDTDKTVSQSENRTLKAMPEFTVEALFSGEFIKEFDEYYSDTFPLRDTFLSINQKISNLFSKTSFGDDIVIVEKDDKDDFAGQNID